jgi:Arc/MetJ-type ribon-helix-helix transcriptional regulator
MRTTTQPEDAVRHLGKLWDQGKSSGNPRPFDIERVINKAKSRLAEARLVARVEAKSGGR